MMRVGIIGCGRVVEEGHARAWQALSQEAQVSALADPSPLRREVVGGLLGVPQWAQYEDYREMLLQERLELVDIAVPHFLHLEVAITCAQAGVHLLLEKPMATTLPDADRILAAVEKAGVKLCVMHNYLYHPHIRLALSLMREGKIGRPFLIRSEGLGGGHYPGAEGYDPDWRTRASLSGGGCLLDNGYHNLYLAEALMGSPVAKVYAQVGTFTRPIEVDDLALILLTHQNGGLSSIQVSWAVPAGGQRVGEVHGTAGSIHFGREGKLLGLYENQSASWSYPEAQEGSGHSFTDLIGEYLAALREGRPPPIDGEAARRNLALVLAAYDSARRGQAVDM